MDQQSTIVQQIQHLLATGQLDATQLAALLGQRASPPQNPTPPQQPTQIQPTTQILSALRGPRPTDQRVTSQTSHQRASLISSAIGSTGPQQKPTPPIQTFSQPATKPTITTDDFMSAFAMGHLEPLAQPAASQPAASHPPSQPIPPTPTHVKRIKLTNSAAPKIDTKPVDVEPSSLSAMFLSLDTPVEPTPLQPSPVQFFSPLQPIPPTLIQRNQFIFNSLATQGPPPTRMAWCKTTGIIALSCRISTLVSFEECGPCGLKAGGRAHPDLMFQQGDQYSKTWKMGRIACRVRPGDPKLDPHRDPTLADHVAIHMFRPSFPSLTHSSQHAPGTPGFFTSVREAHQHHSNNAVQILEWNDTGDLLCSADSKGRLVIWYTSPIAEQRHIDPIPSMYWRGGNVTDWNMFTLYDVDSVKPTHLPLIVSFKWFSSHTKHLELRHVYSPKSMPPMHDNVSSVSLVEFSNHAQRSYVQSPMVGAMSEEAVGSFGFLLLTRFGRIRCFKGTTAKEAPLATWHADIPKIPLNHHIATADIVAEVQSSYLIATVWSKNIPSDSHIDQHHQILVTKAKVEVGKSRLTVEALQPVDLTPLREKLPNSQVLHLKFLTPSDMVLLMCPGTNGPTMACTLSLESGGDTSQFDYSGMLTGNTADVQWILKSHRIFQGFPTSLDVISSSPFASPDPLEHFNLDVTLGIGWSDGSVTITDPSNWDIVPPCMRIMDPVAHRGLRGKKMEPPPSSPVVCNDGSHTKVVQGLPQTCIGSPNGVEVLALRTRSFNVPVIPPELASTVPQTNLGHVMDGYVLSGQDDYEEEVVVSRVASSRLPEPPSLAFVIDALSRMFVLAVLNHYDAEDVIYRTGVMDLTTQRLFNCPDLVERVWDKIHILFDAIEKTSMSIIDTWPEVGTRTKFLDLMGVQMQTFRSLGGTKGLVPLDSSLAVQKALSRHNVYSTLFIQFQLVAIARAFLDSTMDKGHMFKNWFASQIMVRATDDIAANVSAMTRNVNMERDWNMSYEVPAGIPEFDMGCLVDLCPRALWVLDLCHILHRELFQLAPSPMILHAPVRHLLMQLLVLIRLYRNTLLEWMQDRQRFAEEEVNSMDQILNILQSYGENIVAKTFGPLLFTLNRHLDREYAKKRNIETSLEILQHYIVRCDLIPGWPGLTSMIKMWPDKANVFSMLNRTPDGAPLSHRAEGLNLTFKTDPTWLEIGEMEEEDLNGIDRVYCGEYEEALNTRVGVDAVPLAPPIPKDLQKRWDVITKQRLDTTSHRQCLRCRHYSGSSGGQSKIGDFYSNVCSCGGYWRRVAD